MTYSKIASALLLITAFSLPASAEVEVPKALQRNWSLSPATIVIAKGQACKMLQDGQSTIATRDEVANQLMDTETIGRWGANRVASIIIKQSAACRTSTIVVTKHAIKTTTVAQK